MHVVAGCTCTWLQVRLADSEAELTALITAANAPIFQVNALQPYVNGM